MAFELNHLQAFLQVAGSGSISSAARALSLPQPVLSRRIRALEDILQIELFNRNTHGIELTLAGRALLRHAKELTAEAAGAVEAMAQLRGLQQGVLRVGAMGSALRSLVPYAIDNLLQRHPGLTAFVLDGSADHLAVKLITREVDVLVASDLLVTDEIAVIGALKEGDCIEVVAGTSHALAGRKCVAPVELAQFPWVLSPKGTEPRHLFDETCRKFGLTISQVAVEAQSAASIKALLATGRYLGWLSYPHYLPEKEVGILSKIEVHGFAAERRFMLYRRRFGILPRAAQELVDLLAGA